MKTMCSDATKEGKGYFKVRQLEEPSAEKKHEKSIRQIRIRHSDLNSGEYDPLLRYWIKIYYLSGPRRSSYLAQVFVDTGANNDTISRTLFEQLIDRGLVSAFVKGPESSVRINLVGGQTLIISGETEIMEVDVATNMGIRTSIQEFLILEYDTEPLVMGVHGICHWSEKLWQFDQIGEYGHIWNPLDAIEDKAEEDQILQYVNLDVYPEAAVEEPEAYNQCFFDQDSLKSIVRRYGQILFRSFDQKGLRVESLH